MSANPKSRGERKKPSPTSATGGMGPAFENRVQAHRLMAMCLGFEGIHGIPSGFRITELKFQARGHGFQTDDLVCEIEDAYGTSARLLMQMKRTLAPAGQEFEETIGLAWLDFRSGHLPSDDDRIIIVYDVASVGAMKGAFDIAKLAQTSTSAASFEAKAVGTGISNPEKRKALTAIQSALDIYEKSPVPLSEVYALLQHVDFLYQDLDSDDADLVSTSIQHIRTATAIEGRPRLAPDQAWGKLRAVCSELNGRGGELNLDTVRRHIGPDLEFRFKAFRQHQSDGSIFVAVAPHIAVPRAVGATFAAELTAVALPLASAPQGGDLIPAARAVSAGTYISRQLNRLAEDIKHERFADSLRELETMGQDLGALDIHQQARWYLMRGNCVWNVYGKEKDAADDFLKAADLCDDDDKLAAARVRGHAIKGDYDLAIEAGKSALARFPSSLAVWISLTNARVLNGEVIGVANIQAIHADNAAAYQVVAHAASKAGDVVTALNVALTGLGKPDASFFTREAALRYGLELAVRNPLSVTFRLRDEDLKAELRCIADTFFPREDKLWAVQSKESVSVATTHLSYVYLLLGEPEQTLRLLEEAATKKVDTGGTTIRPHMEALRDLERHADAIAVGRPHLGELPAEVLVAFAQLAADEMDAEAFAEVVAQTRARPNLETRRGELLQTLEVLRMDMLIRRGEDGAVRDECVRADVLHGNSFERILIGARAFLRSSDPAQAKAYIDRARELANTDEHPGAHYLFGRLLIEAKEFREAADVLTNALPPRTFGEPHIDLLFSLLRSGQRAKARNLISDFPAGWSDNTQARQLAIELGQQAGDWTLLETLLPVQKRLQPTLAMTWMFALMVAARRDLDDAKVVLPDIPAVLEGSPKEITQIASYEMRGGSAEAGLRRLYRHRRSDLASTDTAAAYYTAMAFAPSGLPGIELEMQVVAPGTSVLVRTESGKQVWRTIDPPEVRDLPSTEEFLRFDSAEGARLIGLKVGDEIVNKDTFGSETKVVVAAITSAYRRLMTLADEALKDPLALNTGVGTLSFDEDVDGNLVLDPLVEVLTAKAARANRIFELYKTSGLTLGGLGRMLDATELDLARGWPHEGPQLQVGGGSGEERLTAMDQLSQAACCVVDLSALVELALLGKLELLASLPRVLVTSSARDMIERELEHLSVIRSEGRSFAHDGKLGFAPTTDADRAYERAFLVSLREAIDKHASLVPAYGPVELNPLLPMLSRVVSTQEYAAVMAALEHQAILVTLDGRLRAYTAGAGIKTAWPQVVLLTCWGQMKPGEYSIACVRMLLARRDFISIHAGDLEVALNQGNALLSAVVNQLREYFADPNIDFPGAADVVFKLLGNLYQRGNAQFGAILELFSYLLEPLLRHPRCPANYASFAAGWLQLQLGDNVQKAHHVYALQTYAEYAAKRALSPSKRVVVRAQLGYCSVPPSLVNGLTHTDDPTSSAAEQISEMKDGIRSRESASTNASSKSDG